MSPRAYCPECNARTTHLRGVCLVCADPAPEPVPMDTETIPLPLFGEEPNEPQPPEAA